MVGNTAPKDHCKQSFIPADGIISLQKEKSLPSTALRLVGFGVCVWDLTSIMQVVPPERPKAMVGQPSVSFTQTKRLCQRQWHHSESWKLGLSLVQVLLGQLREKKLLYVCFRNKPGFLHLWCAKATTDSHTKLFPEQDHPYWC